MDIKVYKTSDKPNTINKKLTTIKNISGNAIEPIDLISPVIKVKIDRDLLSANFCYIDNFRRFYFIKNIILENGFMKIELEVDVLESHKTDILAYNGTLARSEYDYNLLLEDNLINAYSNQQTQVKKFPYNAFLTTIEPDDKRIVLITMSN